MNVELYLAPALGNAPGQGQELLYAGRFELDEPAPAPGEDDPALLTRVVDRFSQDPPAGYNGHSPTTGDVVTLFEEGRAPRSYQLTGIGYRPLAEPVADADLVVGAVLSAHGYPSAAFGATIGGYWVSFVFSDGVLSPSGGRPR